MVTLVGGAAQTGSTQWQHTARAAGQATASAEPLWVPRQQGLPAAVLCRADQVERQEPLWVACTREAMPGRAQHQHHHASASNRLAVCRNKGG